MRDSAKFTDLVNFSTTLSRYTREHTLHFIAFTSLNVRCLGYRYPLNAKRPKFNRMVRPTLGKMLTIIQKSHPLSNEGTSSGYHFHLEHHIVCDLFQVAYDFRL